MGGGGGGKTSGTQNTTQSIDPTLQPLFGNTSNLIQGMQPSFTGNFAQFAEPQSQYIPGLTQGQQNVLGAYGARAFGEPFNAYDIGGTNYAQTAPNINAPEYGALGQINRFTSGEIGSSPATQAAMAAARDPALQDLALAGLGNSDAVGTSLTGAYAPILAQEMAIRAGVIPQLMGLGQQLRGGTQFAANYLGQQGQQWDQRQAANLAQYGTAEEQSRAVQAQMGEADYQDMLRRQGLMGQYSTGILSGLPQFMTGSNVVSSSKQSGGGTLACGVLREAGLMDLDTYLADAEFGRRLPKNVMDGYHLIIRPLVRRMRRDRRILALFAPIILIWASHMLGVEKGLPEKRSFVGWLMLKLGVPFCGFLGFVIVLFTRRCPSTVPRFIIAVRIWETIKTLSGGSFSHICQEKFKRIKPAWTNRNSSTTVSRPKFRIGVKASRFHCNPRSIGSRLFIDRMAVGERIHTQNAPFQTTTACSIAAQKIFTHNYRSISARTLTQPERSLVSGFDVPDDGQLSKNLTSEIFAVECYDFRSHFAYLHTLLVRASRKLILLTGSFYISKLWARGIARWPVLG